MTHLLTTRSRTGSQPVCVPLSAGRDLLAVASSALPASAQTATAHAPSGQPSATAPVTAGQRSALTRQLLPLVPSPVATQLIISNRSARRLEMPESYTKQRTDPLSNRHKFTQRLRTSNRPAPLSSPQHTHALRARMSPANAESLHVTGIEYGGSSGEYCAGCGAAARTRRTRHQRVVAVRHRARGDADAGLVCEQRDRDRDRRRAEVADGEAPRDRAVHGARAAGPEGAARDRHRYSTLRRSHDQRRGARDSAPAHGR